ncbi:MAG: hypothetical protein K6T86_06890 [Pirellulales bacterium]|nr:hypothetical protein [Pirellulales bacterium]
MRTLINKVLAEDFTGLDALIHSNACGFTAKLRDGQARAEEIEPLKQALTGARRVRRERSRRAVKYVYKAPGASHRVIFRVVDTTDGRKISEIKVLENGQDRP